MTAPYYVGDEVPLKYTAKDASDNGPSSATVDIYDETNTKVVDADAATVVSTTVTYNVAESITDGVGTYRAVFTNIFTGTITRQYTIHFIIQDATVRYMTYGNVAGVEGYVGDIVPSRTFTDSTVPTFQQVQGLLDGIASEINVELLRNDYATPVTYANSPEAYTYLQDANNAGAAAATLSTKPMESYVIPDNEQTGGDRRQYLDRRLWHAIKRIKDNGLPAAKTVTTLGRIFSGSQEDSDGNTKLPLFTRDMTDYPSSRSLVE